MNYDFTPPHSGEVEFAKGIVVAKKRWTLAACEHYNFRLHY